MSPRDSASSDDSFSEAFADPVGAFQAHKRLALEKYGYGDRFKLFSKNDDLSERATSPEDITDDSPAAAFRARKLIAREKYGLEERSLWFHDHDLTETSSSESTSTTIESTSTIHGSFSSKKQRRMSSVRFSTVSVRSFDRTVGEHPCCHDGPALTLDWAYQQQPDISVEKYETTKKPRKRRLFPWERRRILSCWSKVAVTKEQVESERKQTILNKLAKLFCHKS